MEGLINNQWYTSDDQKHLSLHVNLINASIMTQEHVTSEQQFQAAFCAISALSFLYNLFLDADPCVSGSVLQVKVYRLPYLQLSHRYSVC